jgi:hypothetical protein
MVLGSFFALGIFPYEGSILPYGFHNMIPNNLRNSWFYIPKTNVPLPHFGFEWGNYAIYPLGMKALPNRQFLSINRQMYRAIIDTDFDKIEKIADNPEFNLTKDIILPDLNYTAIGMASALNLIEVVHYIIKKGVDLEYKIGPYNKTALHIAVEHGNELLAKLLLNNGADIYAKDKFGLDIYDKAEFRGLYHYKLFFDYFKENPKQKGNIDYEEYKYTSEFVLEDIDTNNFMPSHLLEFSIHNKLNPDIETEKINLNKFEFYMFNQFDMKKLEAGENLRKRYDSLYHFNNIKL